MTIGPYPISRMPHIERLEADEAHLVKNLNFFTPGDPEYDYYADCLEENARRLELRRLMMESDKRDALAIVVEDIAENVSCMIGFELELIGEVDEIDETHYLAGPNYEPGATPDEAWYRAINAMSGCGRGPEPMLDRG